MDYYRRILAAYEQEVLKSLPNPFGSFEKATYTLKPFSAHRGRLFKFTTTAHNTEDAIEIMRDAFNKKFGYKKKTNSASTPIKYFRVYKKVGNREEIVYESKRDRP